MKTAVLKSSLRNRKRIINYLKKHWTLYLLLILPIAFFVVFRYIPMTYILIAFKKYSIIKSVWEMPWADNHGFEYFIKAFSNRDFLYALRNTVMLNLLDLLVGFPAPIILALLLNELPFKRFKRITQTVAYMPHFLSWIIIYGMALHLLAPTSGLINIVLNRLGFDSVPFLNSPTHWVWTYVLLGVWQSVGWNTIIYLAALTSIDPQLYEAAAVDGAGRFRMIWHITLPGLRPTIVTLLILNLGRILSSEFDRPYALGNPLVKSVSNVIATFVYTNGIRGLQFSLTTAVGLFQSVVCVIFLFAADSLAKRFGERGIW
ncbi:MAG: ABC transporter permease subunit [Bacillota bacterium]|jgi:putative aldouronate transport system permease protein|nr:sugar ABC transporter permease [Bacillota bacterium]HOB91199.1 ABC transporter permease subunit [Bacillota bacterium]HPZ54326.1 ABC transporter permease subunit [Bacillota bacterium]HQD17609.1 ABC transporter permease subunit [Bacillota bacterium]